MVSCAFASLTHLLHDESASCVEPESKLTFGRHMCRSGDSYKLLRGRGSPSRIRIMQLWKICSAEVFNLVADVFVIASTAYTSKQREKNMTPVSRCINRSQGCT